MSELLRDPRSIRVGKPTAEVDDAPEPPRADRVAPKRRFRRRLLDLLGTLWLFVFVIGAVVAAITYVQWRSVERVDVADVLGSSGAGTNYLIVGTDSRDGIDASDENASSVLMDGLVGTRSDTMAVMRIHDGEVALLAIPRDLYVTLPSGISGRINASFAIDGPAGLISTIQSNLGIPIDHYLEIDLAGFTGMVDALGGITIDFRYPASDPISGLEVSSSGPTELNGAQALAFVRSRQYTEVIDGQSVTDVTGDLGRVVRQQQFIAAVMADLGSTRNPLTLLQSANALGEYAVIDSSLTLGEVVLLAGPLRGADPVTATLPTTAFTTSEGAQVLSLGADADSVLAFFRGG